MPDYHIAMQPARIHALAILVLFTKFSKRIQEALDGTKKVFENSGPTPSETPRADGTAPFLAAAIFVLLGVETSVLIPWAAIYTQLSAYGLFAILVSFAIFLAAYFWIYREGAFGSSWRRNR